jgi:hypothetical protein
MSVRLSLAEDTGVEVGAAVCIPNVSGVEAPAREITAVAMDLA